MSSDGRESASALIGDSRNDGNIIISQLHSMMLRFHNRVADLLRSKSFSEIQQVVRFHYQWIVIHDFLETIIGTETLRSILPHLAKGSTLLQDPPQLRLYTPRQQGGIPIEFSLAVFRFGHSMLRPSYRLNAGVDPLPFFSAISPHGSLMGGRAWPPGWSIDWNFFFKMSTDPERCESKRVQYSYKIDTSIVNLLSDLPGHSPMHSLTLRNLLRGLRTGLPSGQAVSTDMKITSISDDRLTVGKATERDTPHNKPLVSFSRRFKSNAPLWYYILAEAQQQFVNDDSPIRLGPVGGRIVGEVLIGLMLANSNSFLRQDPLFRPLEALRSAGGQFRMADLLGHALQA
jgi:hypothetical protein